MKNRIDRRFEQLEAEGRSALVTFVTAGDPTIEASAKIIDTIARSGADVIELGMPFTDPMADGPTIQAASLRALAAGMTVKKTLELVSGFRKNDNDTPIVLMGYYNPIHSYGVKAFSRDAAAAGVDGLIIVDLPPEEEEELTGPARAQGLHFIRLVAPTSDEARLPALLKSASGFLYYVSVTGVTGGAAPDLSRVARHFEKIRAQSRLPIAMGFGIRTADQARQAAAIASGVVVGSVIVEAIAKAAQDGKDPAQAAGVIVQALAEGVRGGRAAA